MPQFLIPVARSIAAATILSAFAFAAPLAAAAQSQGAAPVLLAQANPAPSAPQTQAPKAKGDRIETHIKQLHDQLKITSAQEQQWDAVAAVMRDNADAMRNALEKRREAKGLSAVDDLKSYQAITETHAQGLQKLIPAFQALYDTMSPEQKQTADALFSQTRHGRHGHHGRMGSKAGQGNAPSSSSTSK